MCTVVEAWLGDANVGLAPSLQQQRREAVMVVVYDRTSSWTAIHKLERDAIGRPSLTRDEPIEASSSLGRLSREGDAASSDPKALRKRLVPLLSDPDITGWEVGLQLTCEQAIRAAGESAFELVHLMSHPDALADRVHFLRDLVDSHACWVKLADTHGPAADRELRVMGLRLALDPAAIDRLGEGPDLLEKLADHLTARHEHGIFFGMDSIVLAGENARLDLCTFFAGSATHALRGGARIGQPTACGQVFVEVDGSQLHRDCFGALK